MESRKLREVDQTKPLIGYIEKNIKKGYSLDQLRWSLIGQGNSKVAVDKAIRYVEEIQKAQKSKLDEDEKIRMSVIETNRDDEVYAEEEPGFWKKLKKMVSG